MEWTNGVRCWLYPFVAGSDYMEDTIVIVHILAKLCVLPSGHSLVQQRVGHLGEGEQRTAIGVRPPGGGRGIGQGRVRRNIRRIEQLMMRMRMMLRVMMLLLVYCMLLLLQRLLLL